MLRKHLKKGPAIGYCRSSSNADENKNFRKFESFQLRYFVTLELGILNTIDNDNVIFFDFELPYRTSPR